MILDNIYKTGSCIIQSIDGKVFELRELFIET